MRREKVVAVKRILQSIVVDISGDQTLIEWLTESTNLVTQVGLDSLQLVTFMMRAEQQLGIEIEYQDVNLDDVSSIDRFCAFLGKRDRKTLG